RQYLRAGRSGRHPGHEGHGAGPAHRGGLPLRGARLRRLVLPEGHRLAGAYVGRARLRLRDPAGRGGGQPAARRALRERDRHGAGAAGWAGDRGAGAGVQAEHRRHARGQVDRGGGGIAGAGGHRAGVRPGGHGRGAGDAARGGHLLRVALRGGERGGRRGAGHGVERVQVPQPRAVARSDAPAGRLRRPQCLGARAYAPPGLHVLLDRPQARPAVLGPGRGNIHRGWSVTMRLLVTGAAGLIGSHLCEALLGRGCEVVGMDNFITGSRDNLAAVAMHARFEFIRHNVTEYIDLDGPVDWVLHFASPASPRDYLELPIQTLKVGALGTHNALGLAKAKRAGFLLASTSEVYGDPLVHPQREDYWGHVNPIGPRGVYDEAKRFAEAITMAYHRTHGVDTRIMRIFNTHGPRQRLNDG